MFFPWNNQGTCSCSLPLHVVVEEFKLIKLNWLHFFIRFYKLQITCPLITEVYFIKRYGMVLRCAQWKNMVIKALSDAKQMEIKKKLKHSIYEISQKIINSSTSRDTNKHIKVCQGFTVIFVSLLKNVRKGHHTFTHFFSAQH